MNSKTNKSDGGIVRRAFIKSLPVLAGYVVLGTGYGILAYSKGLGLWWPILMSVCIFAGSMQYVAIDLLSGGASLITMAITTLAVNARHILYGLSMLKKYKDTGKKKPYLIFSLTDETYSLLVNDDPDERNNNSTFYLLVSLFDQSYWVLGSIIGVVAGRFININTTGIDFSLTALFVTVAVDQWCEGKKHWPAIAGAVSAIVCRLIFGAGNFLIPTMLAIVICLSAPDIFQRINAKRSKKTDNGYDAAASTSDMASPASDIVPPDPDTASPTSDTVSSASDTVSSASDTVSSASDTVSSAYESSAENSNSTETRCDDGR